MESDVLGTARVGQVLKGKSYNRVVRIYKTLIEALTKLRWQALGEWATLNANMRELMRMEYFKP